MKKNNFLGVILLCLSFWACQQNTANLKPHAGLWRVVLASPGGELPFGLELTPNADSATYTAVVLNGDERLKMDTVTLQGDSIHIPIQIFEAEIVAKISNNSLEGYWKKRRKGTEYTSLPLKATFNNASRFETPIPPSVKDISGTWATTFIGDEGDTTLAVGVFQQQNEKLTGTFLTPTGDYRYLQGNVVGDSLKLSCFDGSHVFLFKAKISDNTMKGDFYAGASGHESWTARKDDKAKLPDANSLTFIKPGYNGISFSFPDLTGKKVSLSDTRYQNKVVILQIMGSWCPNCMDESNFLSPWYKKNKQKGIEIIGLAYEKSADLQESAPKIEKMKKRFEIDYEVLLAGTNDKAEASKTLPMLNKVIGFPTTIIIDKKGKVREIHTGFSGPGTGKYYDQWVADFERLIDKLVAE